jgi:hypothetical protein
VSNVAVYSFTGCNRRAIYPSRDKRSECARLYTGDFKPVNNQATIIGAGLVSGSVLILKSYVAGGSIARPLLGIAIATILLAALDATGLGEIAAPLAILLAGTVVVVYALPLLQKVNKVL